MSTQTRSTSATERILRQLQREVAELRARVDAVTRTPAAASPPRHSKEALAWARRHGIDLADFEPFEPPALGTHTMTVAEAARELNLSIEQVRRHLRSGNLRGMPLGGRAGWRVSRADVTRFVATRRALAAGRK